jgi:hypothetical protein
MPPLWLLSQKSRTQHPNLWLPDRCRRSNSINLASSPSSPFLQRLKGSEPLPESTSHCQLHTHEPSQLANKPANTCCIISTGIIFFNPYSLFLYLRVKKRQHLKSTRSIPPISHKIHSYPKHPHEMNPRFLHPPIRIRSEFIGECTAGVGVGPYIIAGVAEGKSEEGCT